MSECPWCEGGGLAVDGETACDACGGSGNRCDALTKVATETYEWLVESGYGGTSVAMDLGVLVRVRATAKGERS